MTVPMKLEDFKNLQPPDFENGAVLDEISAALKLREQGAMPLSERLREWTDFDGAAYELGVVLGIFKDFRVEGGTWLDHAEKSIFWSRNPLGDTLNELLRTMVSVGILEENDDTQFKWKGEINRGQSSASS